LEQSNNTSDDSNTGSQELIRFGLPSDELFAKVQGCHYSRELGILWGDPDLNWSPDQLRTVRDHESAAIEAYERRLASIVEARAVRDGT
jgi:hypothetical protein